MKCYECKEVINNKNYSLWSNNEKIILKTTLCTHCYVVHYFTKPYLFRKHHPECF